MKNSKRLLAFLFVTAFLALLLQCRNTPSDLDVFFSRVDKTLSKENKRQFIECDNIECIRHFMYYKANSDLKDLFGIHFPERIDNYLDSCGISQYKRYVLMVAYIMDSNGKEYNLDSIYVAIETYFRDMEKAADKALSEAYKTAEINAERNYNKYSIGDTICIYYPFRNSDNNLDVMEFGDPEQSDTLLFMKCVIQKKERIPYGENSVVWYVLYHFNLKVIYLSQPNCIFQGEMISKNMKIDLLLNDYRRDITRNCQKN